MIASQPTLATTLPPKNDIMCFQSFITCPLLLLMAFVFYVSAVFLCASSVVLRVSGQSLDVVSCSVKVIIILLRA